jgi:hypothetical protein
MGISFVDVGNIMKLVRNYEDSYNMPRCRAIGVIYIGKQNYVI